MLGHLAGTAGPAPPPKRGIPPDCTPRFQVRRTSLHGSAQRRGPGGRPLLCRACRDARGIPIFAAPASRERIGRKRTMPAIENVLASAYRVPTAAPESDGTAEWESTTIVLVELSAG